MTIFSNNMSSSFHVTIKSKYTLCKQNKIIMTINKNKISNKIVGIFTLQLYLIILFTTKMKTY